MYVNSNYMLFVRLYAATGTLPSFVSSVRNSVGHIQSLCPTSVTWAVHRALLAFFVLTRLSGSPKTTPEFKGQTHGEL
jgi:hypothetical protein